MSNYCTCHIDRNNCFWCDYQTVKKTLKTYKKANKRYREAIEKAFKELKYGDSYNAELILVEALEESE